jgi:hypothetical protein
LLASWLELAPAVPALPVWRPIIAKAFHDGKRWVSFLRLTCFLSFRSFETFLVLPDTSGQ